MTWLPVSQIKPNTYNPNFMPEETFQALVEDIKQNGPESIDLIHIRPIEGEIPYEIIDGEHRWKAIQKAGFDKIKATIDKVTLDEAKAINYRKNKERGNLDPFKEARLFLGEQKEGLTQEEIADKYGVGQSHIAHRLSLLSIPKKVREYDTCDKLTPSHWELVATVDNINEQKSLVQAISEYDLSVRHTERLVSSKTRPKERRKIEPQPTPKELEDWFNKVFLGNCIELMKKLAEESIDFVMFSPAYYGLRDYGEETVTIWGGDPQCEHEFLPEETRRPNASGGKGHKQDTVRGSHFVDYGNRITKSDFCVLCGAWRGQLGLEPSWRMYVEHIAMICREVMRVLKKTGSMYIVLGDTYAGSHCGDGDTTAEIRKLRGSGFQDVQKGYFSSSKHEPPQAKVMEYRPKCLMGIPWRVAFQLIEEGWILRNDIIWHKPNAMPSSVKDRLTVTHEYIFHFLKEPEYYYDLDAIRQPHKTNATKKLRDKSLEPFNKSYPGGHFSPGLRPEGHLNGKNPGDVFRAKTQDETFKGPHAMRQAPEPGEPHAFHELGKNPGDVIQSKFLTVNGLRNKGASPGARTVRQRVFGERFTERRLYESDAKEIGAYLKHWKKKRGLSTRQIAKKLGQRLTLVEHYFRSDDTGTMVPDKNTWLALKKILGFDDKYDKVVTETRLISQMVQTHPLGRTPPDIITVSPETRTLGAIIGEKGAVKVPGGKGWVGHPPGGMARIVREQDPRWLPPEGKNPRDFWSIPTKPFPEAHFAVYPEAICIDPIKSSCPPDGVVLDPLCGSGTTLVAAKKLGRKFIGIDISPDYVEMARRRIEQVEQKGSEKYEEKKNEKGT